MKNLVKVITCFIVLMSFSCSNDDTAFEESENLESTNLVLQGKPPSGERPSMLAQVVPGPNCQGSKRIYTIYATQFTGKLVNYDREVSVGVVMDNQLIDGGLVTIPANKRVSNNRYVLDQTSPIDGTIGIRIFNVLRDGQDISNQFKFLDQTNGVNSCGRSDLSGPGSSPCGSEGQFDQDNDGICDFADPDFEEN